MQPNDEIEMVRRCVDDPEFFCREVLGVELWGKQVEILQSVRDNSNTIVVSCNAAGKTFVMACCSLWFLYTRMSSLVLTTAPTARQIKSVLWAEIARLHAAARVELGGELLSTELHVDRKLKWMALGIPASEEVRFQGHHAEDLLVIFDEAAGIAPEIYTAAAGNLTSMNARFVLIGNPTSPSGKFFEYSKDPNWHKIQISAFDSPAVVDPQRYPYLVNRKWIDERRAEWGESSPMYQARVLGQFPVEGEDTLIPLNWVERAVRRWKDSEKRDQLVSDHIYLGVDVARYGMDRSVIAVFQPNKVLKLRKLVGKDTTALVQLITQEVQEAGRKLFQIAVDDTGVGGGVVDMCRRLGYPVLPIAAQQRPQNRRLFKRLRHELLWNLREFFRCDELAIPPDDALLGQLTSLRYSIDESGIIQIESKEDMRSRGLPSPDEVDAVALALYGARRIKAAPVVRQQSLRGAYDDDDERGHADRVYY